MQERSLILVLYSAMMSIHYMCIACTYSTAYVVFCLCSQVNVLRSVANLPCAVLCIVSTSKVTGYYASILLFPKGSYVAKVYDGVTLEIHTVKLSIQPPVGQF